MLFQNRVKIELKSLGRLSARGDAALALERKISSISEME